MRFVGDLTSNHTGDTHEWFRSAQRRPRAPEHRFYYFDRTAPTRAGRACSRLPKLDHRDPELRPPRSARS